MKFLLPVALLISSLPSAAMAYGTNDSDSSQCLKTWRVANYTMQAADLGTTIYAIESGRGYEQNPMVKGLFGPYPSSMELAAVKVAGVGVQELATRVFVQAGHEKLACRFHQFSAIVTGTFVGMNLGVAF